MVALAGRRMASVKALVVLVLAPVQLTRLRGGGWDGAVDDGDGRLRREAQSP